MTSKDINSILSLLSAIKPIAEKIQNDEKDKQAQGGNFNLFSVLGIERREIYVCRMIGDLLSPQGKHGLGSVFIKQFFTHSKLEALNITDAELENAIVLCEDATGEGKRIDLTIQTLSWIIPIEAKIDAQDQPHQCADYFLEVEKRAKIYGKKSSKIYYLTLDGRQPSPISMIDIYGCKLFNSQVETLTWKGDILPWLEECSGMEIVQRRSMVQANIFQLVHTIKGWEGIMDSEILKQIKSKPENLNSAIQIWHSIEASKGNIWRNFTKPFIQYAHKNGITILSPENDKSYFECVFIKDKIVVDKELDISLFLGKRIGFRVHQGGKIKKFNEIGLTLDNFIKSNIFPDDICSLSPSQDNSCIHEFAYPTLDEERKEPINFFDFNMYPATMKLLLESNLENYVALRVIPLIEHLTGWKIKEGSSCGTETQGD